jgi:hypothetical protein
MELSSQDAGVIQKADMRNFRILADEFLISVPGFQNDVLRGVMAQMCMQMSPIDKLLFLKEIVVGLAVQTGHPHHMTTILSQVEWFLSRVHGRAILIVLWELWEALFRAQPFNVIGCALATSTLLPELVQRFCADGEEEEEEEDTKENHSAVDLSFDYHVYRWNRHNPHWVQAYVDDIPRDAWKQAWDESVTRGRTAYSAQLVTVLLSHTPLPTVLVTLITHLMV